LRFTGVEKKGKQKMSLKQLNGDQAMAYGALSCGVKLVTSYPGSPSSGTVDALIGLAREHNLYVEWSSNEKVAMEMGIGASIAGRRALVCTKSVGLNVMVDPLMALNLTPINGGLVILLGDDPGGYGSQNDQDSRLLAASLELPMMEPAGPAEAYAMMREAFALSERFQTAVIIRETRSFSQQVEMVSVLDAPYQDCDIGCAREPFRFVPVPINAVEKHRALHERIEAVREWAESSVFNRETGTGTVGIIGGGFAYKKLLDVVGEEIPEDFRLLKLGILYPLPKKAIADFLQRCQEVLVIEESEPFLETYIQAIAHERDCSAKIVGKQNPHIPQEGELFRWQIQRALTEFLPGFVPAAEYLEENEADERPKKRDHCAECRYDEVLDKLEEAAESLGQKPFLVGDPGCLVTVADRIDAKYALGSAVGVADGLSKAGTDEKAVAIFGDSSFFHSALPAVCNAAHNRSDILMIILDNKATATSGFQPHPGVGKNAMGQDAPALDIQELAKACGVKHVFSSGLDDTDPTLEDTFREALGLQELAMVIVRIV
jgi:indolepyruvate ferredoxin oxidoreductase alpha subunit